MKKIIIVLAALIATSSVFSQNEANKWAVGGGISAIDFSRPITNSYLDCIEFKGTGRIFVGRY